MENQDGRIYWLQNQLKIFVWLSIAVGNFMGISFESYGKKQINIIRQAFLFLGEGLATYQYKLLISLNFDQNWDSHQEVLLTNLVTKYEYNGSWTTISKELFLESGYKFLRTSHLCRQKWQNHLDTRLVKGLWTLEQDYLIIKNRLLLGKKWSLIAKVFGPVRTEHMIKNRYKAILKRYSTKKQVRIIEQVAICNQIEHKLFLQLHSLTSPTSTSTGVEERQNFKDLSQKYDLQEKLQLYNVQKSLIQQKGVAKLEYFQQDNIANRINFQDQNLVQQYDTFFSSVFEQNYFKIPYVESFQIPFDLQLIENDFEQPNAILEDPEYKSLF